MIEIKTETQRLRVQVGPRVMAFHPEFDEHVVVNAALGEKADLSLLKSVFQVISTLIEGVPKVSD